jgi:hypothetical protein
VTPVGFVVTTRERVRRETEYDYQSDLQSHAPSVTPIEEPRRRASARSTPTAAGDYPR